MKIKRVMKVAGRDIRSGLRDSMFLIMVIMPFVMAIVITAVTPKSNEITVKFAVTEAMDTELISFLENYGQVSVHADQEALAERVEQLDEVIGFDKTGPAKDDYGILLQGNESEGTDMTGAMLLDAFFGRKAMNFDVRLDDLGKSESPFRTAGSLFIMLYVLAIPGFMVGLSLVEEKESNTMSALNVSPLTIPELILGKALFGSAAALFQMYVIIFMLGIYPVNLLMVLAMWIPGLISGLIIGFLIGVAAKDQIAAIGMMKFSFLPLVVSFAGSLFIPNKWQFFLWWSPFYWMYKAFDGIFNLHAGWGAFGINAGLTLALSLVFLIISSKKIKLGLRSM
jgi:ABC-2 type transport system permease protein